MPRHSVKEQKAFTNTVPRNDGKYNSKQLTVSSEQFNYNKKNASRFTIDVSRFKDSRSDLPIRHKCAFTLAEVLITLAIIGVVAALTMPSLISKNQNKTLVTKMQKFYTTFNEGIKLEEANSGSMLQSDITGRQLTTQEVKTLWESSMAKYFKTIKTDDMTDGVMYALSDGTGFGIFYWAHYHVTYCPSYKKCMQMLADNGNKLNDNNFWNGRDAFLFMTQETGDVYFLEPYTFGWNGKREQLKQGHAYSCGGNWGLFCAKLIQYDGWEIKEDYPR